MWSAVGDVLVLAVGIAVSPVAIGLSLVLLMSSNGRLKTAAFGIGWATCIGVVASIAYLTATAAEVDDEAAVDDGIDLLQIAFGVLFLGVAFKAWTSRLRPGEVRAEPKFFARVDGWSVPGALLGGLAAGVVNVKTIPLAISGGLQLAQAPVDGTAAIGAVAVFVLVATGGVLVLLVATSFVRAERRTAVLTNGRTWLVANMSTIIIVVSLVLGAQMIGNGLSG
jgi:hypothetical protein